MQIPRNAVGIRSAITEINKNEWRALFSSFRQQELERVENSTEEDLTSIRTRVKLLRELENQFLQAYENRKST